MAINAFEGGRRIVALLQALLVLGCLAAVALYHPYSTQTLQTFWPDDAWTISPTECNVSTDHEEFESRVDIGDGQTANINLCFRASRADNGQMLIPYERTGNNRYNMDNEFSDSVEAYVTARTTNLSLSPTLQQQVKIEIGHQWWKSFWNNLKDVAIVLVIGCAIIWIVGFVIGWIVRGFAGIPSGMDHRRD